MKRLRLLWMVIKRISADKAIFAFVANIFIVAMIILIVEPGITRYCDSLWYTFVASSTIGFGDYVAVTLIGRLMTVYIAILQILMIAVLSGVVVSYYLEVIHRREKETITKFMSKLEHLPELSKEELMEISEKIKHL